MPIIQNVFIAKFCYKQVRTRRLGLEAAYRQARRQPVVAHVVAQAHLKQAVSPDVQEVDRVVRVDSQHEADTPQAKREQALDCLLCSHRKAFEL